jgi:DNA-binding beta-propeller fold protein YncE
MSQRLVSRFVVLGLRSLFGASDSFSFGIPSRATKLRVSRDPQYPPGGDRTWDYVTVDPDGKRIYVPRGTHIQVVDEVTGEIVADIPDLKALHGVAVAREFNRGFVTGNDPDARIYLLDLKALKVTGKLTPTGAMGSDSLIYDSTSKRAFINTAASNNAQAVDAATGKIVGTVEFPGRPEAAAPDGKGNMFVNIVDKSEVIEYDTKTLAIKNTWSTPIR